MRFVAVLLLVVVSAFCINGLNCPGYTCVSATNAVGATCGLAATQYFNCPTGYYCNTKANSTGGTCALLLATGTTGCVLGGSNCNPNAVCVLGRTGQGYRSPLNTTVCQAYSYVATAGQPCSDVGGCVGSLTCDYGLCAAKPTLGQSCDGMGCSGSNFCNTNAICAALFSTPVGGVCTDTTECIPGDYCNQASTAANGTCATSGAATNANCNTNTDCAHYETCECTFSSTAATTRCVLPKVYTQIQASTIAALDECLYTKNCGGPFTSLATADLCTACRSEFCTYFNQTLEIQASAVTSSLSCLVDTLDPVAIHTYCTAVSTSASAAVAASLAILIISLFVSL